MIYIGSDHAGYELKERIKTILADLEIQDVGTHSEESTDYPDYAHALADEVANTKNQGILICGSANGVAMAANKHSDIRAAICWTEQIAELARLHNNANVCCLPARFISEELALSIVDRFLNTAFEGGRHERRVNKIPCA